MTQRKSERPIEGLACIVLFDDLCYDVFQHLSTKRHKVRISGGDLRRPAKYQVARTRNSTKLTGVCPRRDPLESGRYAMIIRNAQGVFHHIQTSINIVRFRFVAWKQYKSIPKVFAQVLHRTRLGSLGSRISERGDAISSEEIVIQFLEIENPTMPSVLCTSSKVAKREVGQTIAISHCKSQHELFWTKQIVDVRVIQHSIKMIKRLVKRNCIHCFRMLDAPWIIRRSVAK